MKPKPQRGRLATRGVVNSVLSGFRFMGDKMSRRLIGAQAALAQLPEWSVVEGRDAIRRGWRFENFDTAFAFMTQVALAASRLDHHPEWSNVYDRVEMVLSTHSAGGVTGLDLELARIADAAAKSFSAANQA